MSKLRNRIHIPRELTLEGWKISVFERIAWNACDFYVKCSTFVKWQCVRYLRDTVSYENFIYRSVTACKARYSLEYSVQMSTERAQNKHRVGKKDKEREREESMFVRCSCDSNAQVNTHLNLTNKTSHIVNSKSINFYEIFIRNIYYNYYFIEKLIYLKIFVFTIISPSVVQIHVIGKECFILDSTKLQAY